MDFYDYHYRVIYADTDRMGVTYYGHYFRFFEAARNEYFRELGLPYAECEKKGIFLPVGEAHAKYIAPSTYDDELIVRTSVSHLGASSIKFQYQVIKKETGKVITTGDTLHVFVDKTLRPCRIPDEIKAKVNVHALLRSKS
ncbi:MAG: Acyl-CoA thioester hydrolase YbgC [Candidatus Omnitrophica bacterium ADurb.Bin277]|nr:MAG: Acyl-CoA thioester hydrolase YbgC [Candidatus Omnitrophica bacterium ADurb.Bin277]